MLSPKVNLGNSVRGLWGGNRGISVRGLWGGNRASQVWRPP